MAGYFVLVPADATSRRAGGTGVEATTDLSTTVIEPGIAASRPTPVTDDTARLRAKVEALVNQADESELARLEAAATAAPGDDLL